MRDAVAPLLLEVVGREPLILGADERLEEPPGPPRDPPQCVALVLRERLLGLPGGPAHPVGDQRRGDPRRQDRGRREQRLRVDEQHQAPEPHGHRRRRPHRPDELARARAEPSLGRRGGLPFEHLPMRDEQPVERPRRRLDEQPRLVGEERDRQARLHGRRRHVLQRPQRRERPPPGRPDERPRHLLHQRQRRHRQRQERPDPRRPGEHRPAEHQQQDDRRRHEAPPEVVEHLPPLGQRQGILPTAVGRRHGPAEPGEQLPVAADPAVLAAGVGVVAGREVVEQLDVAHEPAAGVVPLDQVVAEDLVLGERPAGGRLEGVEVVDPLAGEAAGLEEIHVDVGDGRRVRVDPRRAGQDARESRPRRPRQVDAHPRLEDAEPLDDPPLLRVEHRQIQRMRQRADEPTSRVADQHRVGVERDDEPGPRHLREVAADDRVARILRPLEQAVELRELPALPLPAHPDPLAGVPEPLPVEQEELVRPPRGVSLVERLDAVERGADVALVLGPVLLLRVGEVGQQGEPEHRVGVGQEVNLQPLEERRGALGADEHARHDDERRAVLRDPVAEVELRQDARGEREREEVVEDAQGDLRRRQQERHRDQPRPSPGRSPTPSPREA